MDRQKKGAEVSYQIVHLHDFVEQSKKNYMSMSKTLLVRSSSTRKDDLKQTTTAPNVVGIIKRKSAKKKKNRSKMKRRTRTDLGATIGRKRRHEHGHASLNRDCRDCRAHVELVGLWRERPNERHVRGGRRRPRRRWWAPAKHGRSELPHTRRRCTI